MKSGQLLAKCGRCKESVATPVSEGERKCLSIQAFRKCENFLAFGPAEPVWAFKQGARAKVAVAAESELRQRFASGELDMEVLVCGRNEDEFVKAGLSATFRNIARAPVRVEALAAPSAVSADYTPTSTALPEPVAAVALPLSSPVRDYHVARGNQKLGVFAGADAQTRYLSGGIFPTDLVWCEGMPAWCPAAEVFRRASPAAPPPPAGAPVVPAPEAAPAGGAYPVAPSQPKPPNHLVWAILATLFGCMPFGILGIIFAIQVNSTYAAGDYAGARVASGRAKLWSIVAVGSWFLLAVLAIIALVVSGSTGMRGNLPR
jgi:hypothetical protein